MSHNWTEQELIQRAFDFDVWEVKIARFFLKTSRRADFYASLAEMKNQSISEPSAVVNEWNLQTRSGKYRASKVSMIVNALSFGFLGQGAAMDIFLCSLLADMQEGDKLSTALIRWAPEFEQLMLGTQDGLSVESLRILSTDAGKIDKYRRTILGESRSIVIAIAMLYGILLGAGHEFVPIVEQIMSPEKMKPMLYFMVSLSKGFLNWQYLIYFLTIAIPVALIYSLPRWTGRYRLLAEYVIPFSIYKEWTGCVFLITLSSLISTGNSIPNALKKLSENAKPYMRERLDSLIAIDDSGLGQALSESGYEWPDYVSIHKISVYMQSNEPGEALVDIANIQAEAISGQITELAKMLSVLGMLMSSLIITVLSFSVMSIDPTSLSQ